MRSGRKHVRALPFFSVASPLKGGDSEHSAVQGNAQEASGGIAAWNGSSALQETGGQAATPRELPVWSAAVGLACSVRWRISNPLAGSIAWPYCKSRGLGLEGLFCPSWAPRQPLGGSVSGAKPRAQVGLT